VVAAAVGGGASPSGAENVTARGGEIVAREAPGSGQAGIAVLRGSDRVQLLGEREGWSEILLSDGRRAWVPTAEITHIAETPRPSPAPTASPAATAVIGAPDRSVQELGAEIVRLRGVVDELSAWRTSLPAETAAPVPIADDVPWMVAGVAGLIGLLIGGAWERHRSRRDRSLRF
jgi:hypothetical protein